MANTFKRIFNTGIGNVATQLGSYSVNASPTTTTVVVGFSMCNTTGATISATAYINSGGANINLVKSAPISTGGTLVIVGGDQKIVLQANDSIYVQSTSSSSMDAYMSIMEIT